MDPVSLSSGVAGLITLALQIGGTLHKYVTAIKDREKNTAELSQEIVFLQDVLEQLKAVIAAEEEKGRKFESTSVLRGAIVDYTNRIQRVLDKLKTSEGGKIARAIDRLTWPFKETEVNRLVESLRRFHATFKFALHVQNRIILSKTADDAEQMLQKIMIMAQQQAEMYKQFNTPDEENEGLITRGQVEQILDILPNLRQQAKDLNEINQTTRDLEQKAQEDRKAEILDWLLPKSALDKHRRIQQTRAKDTCQWFLFHESFIEWSKAKRQSDDLLCQGPPGAGKTVLSSAVVDHLEEMYDTVEGVAVLHHYCSHSEENAQTPTHLLRSLLRQLCRTRKLPSVVAEFYNSSRNDVEDMRWFHKLEKVFGRVIATFDEVFLVVDALDEAGGEQQRRDLFNIVETAKASNTFIHIFATTRPHLNDINENLTNASLIDVMAHEGDLRRYLSKRIDEHKHSSSIMDVILKEEVIDKLCSNANGIFLLPKLQIDYILDQINRAEIKRALRSLSQSLAEAFKSTLDRIQALPPTKRDLAFNIMMWVAHARRPLKMTELQHALAVRFEDETFDEDKIVPASVMRESCFGLVEDGQDGFVRFVHFSLEEHLRSADHGFFQDAEIFITRICLKYLSSPELKPLPTKNRNNFEIELHRLQFATYATCEWGNHARNIAVDTYKDLALPLMDTSLNLLAMARIRDSGSPDFRQWKERMTSWAYSGGAGISVAASFGLTDLVELLIREKEHPVLHAQDSVRSTPLHHAAALGFTDTCETLYRYGADLRATNAGGQTAFFLAINYGHEATAASLLRHDRLQLDIPRSGRLMPLHRAVQMESEPMVTFLLRSGALVGARDSKEDTALHWACKRGHLAIARLLVLAKADVNVPNADRMMPIDFAITQGQLPLVHYLIEQNADFNTKANDGWRPIHRAARGGHAEVLQLLLQLGALPSQTAKHRITPLQLAAKAGSLECAKLIVEHDPSSMLMILQQKDSRGQTARQIAFTVARFGLYKYLRDVEHEVLASEGSHVEVFDPTLPLCLAIESSNLPSVKAILEKDPNLLHTQSTSELLPVHLAFQEENLLIAEYLLDLGADIQSRAYHGWTPLQIGASVGSLEMVELALRHGAQINAISTSRQTALHKACSSGSVEVVRFLLHNGADPRAVNDRLMTPLHAAAASNSLEVVRELLKPEWGLESLVLSRDDKNELPRTWAERSGNLDLSTFLRIKERRVKALSYQRRSGDLLSPQASALQMVRTNSQTSARSASPRQSIVSSNAGEENGDGTRSRSSLLFEDSAERGSSPAAQLAQMMLDAEGDTE